ncbi:unnamed protein product [Allacma fusca]|uniref:Uncharacterized protein n=1 Tax=Allacma fusca TaxID=39272 RepID=A0A8J2P7Y7_9HEXA|nr:unnamed protein product [Allacma fusca]
MNNRSSSQISLERTRAPEYFQLGNCHMTTVTELPNPSLKFPILLTWTRVKKYGRSGGYVASPIIITLISRYL